MPLTYHTDSNGLTFAAITSTEWAGAYGDGLRAQGYTYCGYGTWGVYVKPAGQVDCGVRTQAPPSGGSSVPPPPTTTGGVGSPPAPTVIQGCGSCRKATTVTGGSAPTPGASTGPGTVTVPGARRTGYPWWVIVLAVMVLAQIVGGKDNGVS